MAQAKYTYPNPSYGTDVNQSLLESINEFGLDQLVTEPAHGRNILDLIFSSHPESISNIEVIPGISDHEAVYCELTLNSRPESDDKEHPVFLYDRGSMTKLKGAMRCLRSRLNLVVRTRDFFGAQENHEIYC